MTPRGGSHTTVISSHMKKIRPAVRFGGLVVLLIGMRFAHQYIITDFVGRYGAVYMGELVTMITFPQTRSSQLQDGQCSSKKKTSTPLFRQ